MNDDELKALWQAQSIESVPPLPDASQIAALTARMKGFDKTIQWRDYREVAACLFILIFFGWDLISGNNSRLTEVGCVVLVLTAVFISWRLISSKMRLPKSEANAPVLNGVKVELRKVENQISLLSSISWWYLVPLFIGVMLHHWGSSGSLFSKLGYSAFVLGLFMFINWLNQRAVKDHLVPLKRSLESLLQAIEKGESFNSASIAKLPPAARSLISTNGPEPITFKVAFWEIALWGEIGFIGIWLFLMIGLGVKLPNGKTNNPSPNAAVQSLPRKEAVRYLEVASDVIAFINAGDYASVHQLYDDGMATAFPAKETIEFYAGIAERYGTIENADGPTQDDEVGWVKFKLHCQNGKLWMKLALNPEREISGIHFRPVSDRSKIGWLIPGTFGWQHLLWLLIFFLGGLLYSRLLQKMTGSAVGLSAIGIHLRGGQTLVSWDELKEVRVWRLLHSRSLWLIKESGEKTIMPWTSLERHSDLKAAVESFAPPDHPIRQYLPLLKTKSSQKG